MNRRPHPNQRLRPRSDILGWLRYLAVAAALAGDRGDVADAARWMAAGQSLAPREPIWRLVDPAVARRGRVTAALAAEISRDRSR